MELGMIGLGRMGTNMVRRLLRAGHRVITAKRVLFRPSLSRRAGQGLVPS